MTISARVVADSVSSQQGNKRITTFELEYPRFIHAEFMTHRLFSRNAASSRAIPVKKAIELIRTNVARPMHWGKNQPGMSAKEECTANIFTRSAGPNRAWTREQAWELASHNAIEVAEAFDAAGYHKQIVNRVLEPFSHIKVVLTATEYDNFYWLRNHPDAQPEICELAQQMIAAQAASTPNFLHPGEWHTPYYGDGAWRGKPGNMFRESVPLEHAIAISASQCAQVSYRKADDTLEKALAIYARLVESKPVHASPFEHQASPIIEPYFCDDEQVLLHDEEGVTHYDRRGWAWSGNFKGWIQNRQLIEGNACWNYVP